MADIIIAERELIWGADNIAHAIGLEPRQVYHLLNSGGLPVAKKVGGKWVVSKRRLWEFFENTSSQAV
jgi:hypothetical protein